jgi:uncharacterized protein (TIGR02594 family)
MQNPKWLDIAVAEIGVKEAAGRKANPRIIEYFRAAKSPVVSDETAWCSAFVAWCIAEAGMIPMYSLGARSWLRWGKALRGPKIGAIAVFPRGTEVWQGHVGFVKEIRDDKVLILGGNQRNSVRADWYDADRAIGYRWPSTMAGSRTVHAQVATLITSGVTIAADAAQEIQPLAEQASGWFEWMQYVALGCAVTAAIATIWFRYQDIKEKGR